MRYVDAGYVIALGALALYTVSLLARRFRLERAAARAATRGTSRGEAARTDVDAARAPRDAGDLLR